MSSFPININHKFTHKIISRLNKINLPQFQPPFPPKSLLLKDKFIHLYLSTHTESKRTFFLLKCRRHYRGDKKTYGAKGTSLAWSKSRWRFPFTSYQIWTQLNQIDQHEKDQKKTIIWTSLASNILVKLRRSPRTRYLIPRLSRINPFILDSKVLFRHLGSCT